MPLRAFFASGIETEGGGEASSTAIQAMIRKLVDAENPRKPLSDASLAEMLKATGVPVARRTVAKYREAMSIPSVARTRAHRLSLLADGTTSPHAAARTAIGRAHPT